MGKDVDHDAPDHDAENCISCQIINHKPFKMLAAGMEVITEMFLEDSTEAGQEIDQAHFLAMMISFVQLLRGTYEVPAEAIFDMMLMVLRTEDENFIQDKLCSLIRTSADFTRLKAQLDALEKKNRETVH